MPEISTRYGVLDVFKPHEDLISRFLSRYGEWAEHELAFIAGCLSTGSRIADIGAFLGTFGLGIAKYKAVSKICFVDANPVAVDLLRRNVARNIDVQCAVVEAVVGGDGRQSEGKGVRGNVGTFSVVHGDVNDRETFPCSTASVSLRSLTEQHGPFDLYKIDAEGMEGEILRQDPDFLRETQSTFWLECNSTVASLDVAQYLLTHGFKVFYFAYPAISRNNFNGESDREYPYAYEAGLWASKTRRPTISQELLEADCVLKEVGDVEALRQALWLTPRWSPKEWEGRGVHEVVALASHSLLGEDYGGFLSSSEGQATVPRWQDPLPMRLQRQIDGERGRLAQAKEKLECIENELRTAKQDYEGFAAQAEEKKAQLSSDLETALSQLRAREGDVVELSRERARLELAVVNEREALGQMQSILEKTSEALRTTEAELRDAKSSVRSHEIMLYKERDRSRDAVKALQAELARVDREREEFVERQLSETRQLRRSLDCALSERDEIASTLHARSVALVDDLRRIQRSRSWRVTMPLRMLGRLARGEYAELRRLVKAKISAS